MSASWRVLPSMRIEGAIRVPGDKSISHRALMFGGIADGITEIEGFLAGEDCLATLRALRHLGVVIDERGPTSVSVRGVGGEGLLAPTAPLDMGNAGTAMRLFMGLLSGRPFDSTLVGDASLMRRPMERAATPLRAMGARIETASGKPPVVLRGGAPLHGIDYAMPVASAQVKSAVLLAGLRAAGRTRVTEPAPTRDHTERMLEAFGVSVRRDGASATVEGGARLRATRIDVPADFSSAAFFLVAGTLAEYGDLTLEAVGMNPTRTGLLELLRAMGADIAVLNPRHWGGEPVADLRVRPARLRGIDVPPSLVPLAIDEFPVFFVAAACAQGPSRLRGAEELRVKESDRLAGMAAGLGSLGIPHQLLPDGLDLAGHQGVGAVFSGGRVDSLGDHRIAMAFAVAALRAAGPIEISDTANVATSFPGFVALARSTGLEVEQSP